jgi:hypothetical protein
MSTQRERREAAKRERKRKERAEAQQERSERVATERRSLTPAASVTVAEAATWPLADAWLGDNHTTHGATVHAGVSTRRDDGRMGAAFFSVDLADGRIHHVSTLAGVLDGNVNAEVVQRATPHAMVFTDPTDVAALLAGALARRPQQDVDVSALQRFLRGQDPALADAEIAFGPAEDGAQTAAPADASPGVWATLKRWVGLS